jgi:hypothetical protein
MAHHPEAGHTSPDDEYLPVAGSSYEHTDAHSAPIAKFLFWLFVSAVLTHFGLAGLRGREEAGAPGVLVGRSHRRRLALPDGQRGVDQGRDVGRRLQLFVGGRDPAVRPRQRRPGRHPRRSSLALLLRHRVLAEGASPRPGRFRSGQNRLGCRRAAAVLLPLQPGIRPLRRDRHEPDPARWCPDPGVHRRVHSAHAASRNRIACGGSRVVLCCLAFPSFRRKRPPWLPRWTTCTS